MSFNQIFPLDAITEVSRETSLSQAASSDMDSSSSQCSSQNDPTAPGMPSLLGPELDLNEGDSLEFQPVDVQDSDDDDDDDDDMENVQVLTEGASLGDVESGVVLLPEPEITSEPEEQHVASYVEDSDPEDTDFEDEPEADVEAGVVIIPEPEPVQDIATITVGDTIPPVSIKEDTEKNTQADATVIPSPEVEDIKVDESANQECDVAESVQDLSNVPAAPVEEFVNLISLEDDVEQPNTEEAVADSPAPAQVTPPCELPRATQSTVPVEPIVPANPFTLADPSSATESTAPSPTVVPAASPEATTPTESLAPAAAEPVHPVSTLAASPVKASQRSYQVSTEEIPPATPSPLKQKKGTHSPAATEPLTPEKFENEQGPKAASSELPRTRKRSRCFMIGIVLLLIGILVGVVVFVMGGGSSSSASASVEDGPDLPDTPATPNNPSAPNVPPSAPVPSSPSQPGTPQPPDDSPGKNPPTPSPSPSPTSTPIADPTAAPTTALPTALPTISVAPTGMPTPDWSAVLPFLTDLTPQDVLMDATTMQGQALLWLLDSLSLNPLNDDSAAIRQRYAASVLDRATYGGNPRVTRVDQNECEWDGVGCVNGVVTSVVWSGLGLTGSLPNEISALTGLITLDLGENALVGPLPAGLFDCTALEFLYLHQNLFSGGLSEDFSRLYDLNRLYLGNNQFTGQLPQGLGSVQGIRQMRFLSVHNNDLTGPIPENWNLRFMFLLDLSNNRLSGNLPLDWGDASLVRIKLLYVDHNELTGPIPSTYPSMGNGRTELMHFSDNLLTGIVPGGFDPVFFISSLELQNNQFSGMDVSVCDSMVLGTSSGEITNFHADCDICICPTMCGFDLCFV